MVGKAYKGRPLFLIACMEVPHGGKAKPLEPHPNVLDGRFCGTIRSLSTGMRRDKCELRLIDQVT